MLAERPAGLESGREGDMDDHQRRGLSRRQFLQAGLGIAGSAVLGGCGARDPDPRQWRNWSGGQSSRPAAWLRPRDEAELVWQLRAASGELRVTGAGHSFSPVCRTEGTLVSIDDLKGVISHDASTLQARVWAGTRLRDLGEPLWNLGQGLLNQGDVDPQSVAGACGTSTHGTGRTLGSFSSVVRGVRLVTPAGEIIEADAARDADVYRAACTSLGVLGVVTQLTLQNRTAYKLREREYTESLDAVLAKLPDYVRSNRHFEFWAFFESDLAIVKTLNETTDEDTPAPAVDLPVDAVLDLASRLAHGVAGMDGAMQRLLTALQPGTERVGRSYRIFPSARNTRFNEMEYEVPVARGPDCLREILAAVRAAGIRTLFPVEYRTVAADDAWLSPFQGRDSASISIHQYHAVDWRELFDLVEPIFWKHEGRPHWGKLHTLTARQLAPLYPHWDDFQRVRRRLDPQGRMLNAHLRAVLEPA